MQNVNKVFVALLLSIIMISCSSTKNTANRDGSSIEKAVKVSDVGAEYQFAKAQCPDCKMKGQALLSSGNKHYDRLTLVRPSGEEVNYFFDITSFYGKW